MLSRYKNFLISMLTDQKVLEIIKQGGRLFNKTIQNKVFFLFQLQSFVLDINK